MAKKIYNEQGKVIGFEPGWIYILRYDDGKPFYVGETTDRERRMNEHRAGGKNATPTSETKYQVIKQLDALGVEWWMDTVTEYGSEGPEALEDETIMGLLYDGYTLTNEQKGNANWLMERQAVAADMRERGIRSYHEYRKIIEIESGKSSRETPSPKSHEAVDRILNEAWNRSLQPEKKRTVTAPDLKEQKRMDSIAEETIRLSEVLPVEEQIAILQKLVLTYQQYGCSEALLQNTLERLHVIQELAK